MPFLSTPFSWTSLITLHDWLPLIPADSLDSPQSHDTIQDFIDDLLTSTPLTVPALTAIAYALSVNISINFSSTTRAPSLAGVCQFLATDNSLNIDVLPRASTIRLSLSDTALSQPPPTV
jgi:hypothetical protein